MTGNEYQELAMRTNDGYSIFRLARKISNVDDTKDIGGIINGCLGLSGESGEFNDLIKKWLFHGHDLDEEHAKKECGDIFWYLAVICKSFGWDMDEIMQINIKKLRARYPEGFSTDRSEHRKDGDV